ncbi:2-hydroxyacid dehydrogenase [Chloroflexota bacterium]
MEQLTTSAPEGFSVVGLPRTASLDEMVREFKDAHFLIVAFGASVPDEAYRVCKHLKLVQSDIGGYSHLPVPLLRELGIPAAHNVSRKSTAIVAEHAVTLMLCVLRRIVPSVVAMRQGKWKWDLDYNQYARMYQKTVGIVGLGKIGGLVGRMTSSFGTQVIFCDTAKIPLATAMLIPGRQVTFEELLRTADIVSLHVPRDTRGLIGRRELELMKPTAILINTSKGPVVDEAALIEALQNQRIAGAGLDVFEQEPVDLSNPLLHMEQVVCTPHIAGAARENLSLWVSQSWENIEAVLRGESPAGLVDTPDILVS